MKMLSLKLQFHILALYVLVSLAKSSVNLRKVSSPTMVALMSKDIFCAIRRNSPLDSFPRKLRLRGGQASGPSQSDLESVKGYSKPDLESPDDAAADAEIEALISQLEGNLTGIHSSEDEAALFEEEERPLKEKATLFPTHLPSLYNYARFLQVHKKYEAAMELYLKCLQFEPKDSWKEGLAHSHCNYGLILHVHKGNSSGAEHYYKQALSIDPNHVCTLNNYGKLLEGGEKTSSRVTLKMDLDGAENLYTRALQADPDHVPTLINFGYFKEKVRPAEAFERASMNPVKGCQ
jgi:tetratricopeptide (TPR) repeat protein